ncbi:MAG: beta-propeller fold lactonase family protein [Actinomycetes bacterium]
MSRARFVAVAAVLGALAIATVPAAGTPGPPSSAGNPLTATDYRLPNGWHLHPAGTEVQTERGPTGLALTTDRKHLLVTTSGLFDEGIDVVDTRTLRMVPTEGTEFFRNPAVTPDGYVYAANGHFNTVSTYRLVRGVLHARPPATINTPGWPGPIVTTRDGRVFVGGTVSTETTCAAAAPCSVVNILNHTAVHHVTVGRDAIALALNPSQTKLYVANWADASVSIIDVARRGVERVVQTIAVGQHPLGLAVSPDGGRLAVANAADDTVTLADLDADGLATGTHATSLRLRPDAPLGTAPNALGYAADGSYLYVALSGLNAVEVLTADGQPIPRTVRAGNTTVNVPHTWIGTGWWPDALVAAPAASGGNRLYVANVRGDGSGPGFYPQVAPVVGSQTEGSVSVIDLPTAATAGSTFDRWTSQVVANDQLAPLYNASLPDPARDACTPPGDRAVTSAILCAASRGQIDPRALHVIIVNNENKTFDSYFGDIKHSLPGADADPRYTEYGIESTPNQHRLAEQYNLDDSFYTDGDSSIEGHEWLTGGYEPDATAITWGQQYDEDLRGNRDSAGAPSRIEGALRDPRQRIFDEITNPATNPLGLTEAIYGDDVNDGSAPIADEFPLKYWGLGPDAISGKDMTFPDVDRAQMFLHGTTISHAWNWFQGPQPPSTFLKRISLTPTDKQRFTVDGWTASYHACIARGDSEATCQRAMPNLSYMVFPVNHTYVLNDGFNPLDPTPHAEVADNDAGVGEFIAGLSRSPFWKNTLVLLTQDDTQFVGDHVDIHRSFLLTMGGLSRQLGPSGQTAHQPGSYPAALKTAETLLGLPPLSIFDWRAAALADVVGDLAHTPAPYNAVRPATAFLVPPPWRGPPPSAAGARLPG